MNHELIFSNNQTAYALYSVRLRSDTTIKSNVGGSDWLAVFLPACPSVRRDTKRHGFVLHVRSSRKNAERTALRGTNVVDRYATLRPKAITAIITRPKTRRDSGGRASDVRLPRNKHEDAIACVSYILGLSRGSWIML